MWAVEGCNGAGRPLARPQRLLSELIPGKAKKNITAPQAKTILARDSTLMDLTGVGPVVAARILADVGDAARFADRNRFASWTAAAPLDASFGEQIRHRLSRAGNRRANQMIHIAAACQIRLDTPGGAYHRRKLAAGKTPGEGMRCPKRRISDATYRQLVNDANTAAAADTDAGPGGHHGASLQSSAAGSHPHTGTSDQPQPGPAPTALPADTPARKTTRPQTLHPTPWHQPGAGSS